MTPAIVVGGEALIDLIEDGNGLRPYPGGGPYNTEVALGRLGVPVAFLGRLSEDPFGRLLESQLAESSNSSVSCHLLSLVGAVAPINVRRWFGVES